MVNKQYTVQPARKQPNIAPSASSSVTIIPSPEQPSNNLDQQFQQQPHRSAVRADSGMTKVNPLQTVGGATYARNIAYVHSGQHGPNNQATARAEVTDVMFASAADGGINNLDKDAAIKDIGRFQYILQMDREMATHPNSPAYRLHPHGAGSIDSSTAHSVSASSNTSAVVVDNNLQHMHQLSHQPRSHQQHQQSHFSFWKAGVAPLRPYSADGGGGGSSSSDSSSFGSRSSRRRSCDRWLNRSVDILKCIWLYAKWPLAALFACSVVATLVYFALVANATADEDEARIASAAIAGARFRGAGQMHTEDFQRFDEVGNDVGLHQYDVDERGGGGVAINRTAQLLQLLDSVTTDEGDAERENESISGRLAIFVQEPDDGDGGQSQTDALNAFNDDLLLGVGLPPYRDGMAVFGGDDDAVQYTIAEPELPAVNSKPVAVTTHTTSTQRSTSTVPAATKRFRNTQIIEISTPKWQQLTEAEQPQPQHRDRLSVVPNALPGPSRPRPVPSTLMFPTKETFERFGFTSGHQNNFGVPIEEDERMLRMLNEQLRLLQRQQMNVTAASVASMVTSAPPSSTDSTVFRAHVSPTLPNLRLLAATTTERQQAVDEGICRSTSLPMCRSVLPYDLTSAKQSRGNLSVMDVDHFKYLVESQCSPRAHEFICTVLQPECRPERMGILQPCKRSCKAILEPCAHVIAASEFLTAAFDCDSFPDSHDPEMCHDATRDDVGCFENEFQCDDRTCIPSQWRCDNIKDCADAEDEIECTFCEHDEFRCPDSDKCIPDKWRCDEYDDCPDAADELDCPFGDDVADDDDGVESADESRTWPSSQTQGHGRTFPYTQELSASRAAQGSSSTHRPYNVATAVVDADAASVAATNTAKPTTANKPRANSLDDADAEHAPDELVAEASSGVALPRPALSKSLANFQDSKEIMMTSDSETDLRFATRSTVASTGDSSSAQLQASTLSSPAASASASAHLSPCPVGELRCVSGLCITVSQLCDKIVDCPDGADEAMCVYKTLADVAMRP